MKGKGKGMSLLEYETTEDVVDLKFLALFDNMRLV